MAQRSFSRGNTVQNYMQELVTKTLSFDQTWMRLKAGLSVLIESGLTKNAVKSVEGKSLTLAIWPSLDILSPCLSCLQQFCWVGLIRISHTCCFLLVTFRPLTPTLLLEYKCPFVLVRVRAESNLSPTVVVSTPIRMSSLKQSLLNHSLISVTE